jgi:argininosuccinate synthase
MTKPLARAPEAPALVELAFERGVPVAINGVPMPLTEIIESLSLIAGQHGVGRVEIVEPALTEGGTQERYEAPAAVVLHAAHRALEALVLPGDLALVKRELAGRYTALVHEGGWFTPLREALDAFVASTQERVTGLVPVKLSKAQHVVVGCTSPHASHDDATGSEPAFAAPGMVSRA